MPLLIWPVKSSLLRYVSALPDGALSLEDGVQADRESGVFVFPAEPQDESGRRFRGDLRLRAHGGMLFIRIAQPTLEVADPDDRLDLSVLAPADDGGRLVLAHLTERARSGSAVLYDARLSEPGAGLFGGYYRPGEQLDPLELRRD